MDDQRVPTASNFDPVLREVIRHRLMGVVGEMSEALKRAAYTPTIYEVLDFSNALHNAGGDVVAQALGIPIFLGAMSASCQAVMSRFSVEHMEPGDIFICNDPHVAGGTHVNDVNVMMPVFHAGKVVFFTQSKAHWRDVGGKDVGSWCPDATSIYQEGLRLPPVKLYSADQLDEGLLDVITCNSRLPENVRGDLFAQVAACRVGEKRLGEVIARYGMETVLTAIDAILDHGERLIRAEIAQIPDGVYQAEQWLEGDGFNGESIVIRVAVTVNGSDLTVDFSGTAQVNPYGISNTVLAGTVSAVRMAVKCLTDPNLPANEGCYRPIKVIAPKDTCVNAQPPAPVTIGLGTVNHVIIEVVIKALAPVIPDRVIAGTFGSINAIQIYGMDPTENRIFIYGMPHSGGWGARAGMDGISALQGPVNGDCRNIPIEIVESKFPIRVERFELIQDSGGPGRTRGGLGIRTDYRVLGSVAQVNTALMHYQCQPKGLFGGNPGAGNVTVIISGEQHTPGYRLSGYALQHGDIVSHRMGGGGGYGPAWERPVDRVASDICEGYVSAEAACRQYGVASHADGTVDPVETARLRSQMEVSV